MSTLFGNADYSVLSLKTIIEDIGRDGAELMLSGFVPVCDDASPVKFLREDAIAMELRGLSRTHLVLDNDAQILGFFTLGVKCTRIPEENRLSKSTLKRMNIESATGVAQSYLLGQLCRSKASPPGFGKELINRAFKMISVCNAMVGCRMIRLDCEDGLIGYYEKYGFKLIRCSPDGTLNQMMTILD